MNWTPEKTREQHLRRRLRRAGLRLEKSRAKDPIHRERGTFRIVEGETVLYHAEGYDFGLGLDDVEQCIDQEAGE